MTPTKGSRWRDMSIRWYLIEEMIKGLLKRINEKDQFIHELQLDNVRLSIENGQLKSEVERLKKIIHEMGSEFAV